MIFLSALIVKLEYSLLIVLVKVQSRTARFIKRDYGYDSSVSRMLKDLDLSFLEKQKKNEYINIAI